MTLYLLDANVLIRAHEDYYPVDRIPAFWAWLLEKAEANVIKMPRVILDEITPPPGPFAAWLADKHVKDLLISNEAIPVSLIRRVIDVGYAPDLTDVELSAIGKDPFLIALAMAGNDRIVVTIEVSKPSKIRQNRKVPDVCKAMGIKSIHPFELYKALKFSIPRTLAFIPTDKLPPPTPPPPHYPPDRQSASARPAPAPAYPARRSDRNARWSASSPAPPACDRW